MLKATPKPKSPIELAVYRLLEVSDRLAAAEGVDEYKRFEKDPVGFAKYVWPYVSPEDPGFEPWSKQIEVAQCLIEHRHITVPAGRAVGKSRLDAWLALWFAICTPMARVILTAPTFKQVQQTLWEEIQILVRTAKRKLPIEVAKLASTGARAANGSQILGITADTPEAFQGIRGARMLVIADEASGIPDEIFHVIDGNTAGGAYLALTGNPTRTRGYFRDSFKNPRFKTITISSEDSPNVVTGKNIVLGLATRAWVEDRKREWGTDSPLYQVHVLGKPVTAEEGQLFPLDMLEGAKSRWVETPANGRLVIGLDPAGEGGTGDESAFACRRGHKIVWLDAFLGLSAEQLLVKTLGYIATHKGDSTEVPLVVLDREGEVGWKVYGCFKAFADSNPGVFQLYGVRSSDKAKRKPLQYERVRDEMWFNLADHFRAGLVIPTDLRLEKELAEFKADAALNGKSIVTRKKDIKVNLDGRSPDRADAVALSCMAVSEWVAPAPTQQFNSLNPYVDSRQRGIDPYASLDAWR